ncbi:MAG: 4'-phosphopantetheinyl transferase superfamily protein [Lachnospiraceae bacterium]|nr:4'-phosphopantetheinyl transferase superfamily protein [Lachnospiraceae bacterium]
MLECYYIYIEENIPEGELAALLSVLPEERQERFRKLQQRERAGHYIVTSAFMQYGISRALELPIQGIRYQYGIQGKPELVESLVEQTGKADFSLSHSGSYAVLAVSDVAVGMDVERKMQNRDRIAKRFFCREEYEDIQNGRDEKERNRRFLAYWTMKEAYIKRDGRGLQIPLSSFRIHRYDRTCSVVEGREAYFATVPLEDTSYMVSVCSGGREQLENMVIAANSGNLLIKKVTVQELLKGIW